jgi:hypothetical protein
MNRSFAILAVAVILVITLIAANCSTRHQYFVSYEVLTYDNESDVWVIMRDNLHRRVHANSKANVLYELYDIEMDNRANLGFSVDSINIVSSTVIK